MGHPEPSLRRQIAQVSSLPRKFFGFAISGVKQSLDTPVGTHFAGGHHLLVSGRLRFGLRS
jgi:hypothetical protein